jgi:hypothetical protein
MLAPQAVASDRSVQVGTSPTDCDDTRKHFEEIDSGEKDLSTDARYLEIVDRRKLREPLMALQG